MTSINIVQSALKAGAASIAALATLDRGAGLLVLREERAADIARREDLLDAAFGDSRFTKTSELLRAGRAPAKGLALVALCDGTLAGSVRLWHIEAGGVPALLLGPLAVAEDYRAMGIGGRLMREAIARARALGHRAIILVGDAAYYERFGFSADLTKALDLPGPVDRERFLALELEPGALAAARGMVRASGKRAYQKPSAARSQLLAA